MFDRGDVLHPTSTHSAVTHPLRVLSVNGALDSAIVVQLQRRSPIGRTTYYAPLPTSIQLTILRNWISEGSVVVSRFVPPSLWSMTDEDYVSSAPSSKEADARRSRIVHRDKAFDAISPYLKNLTIEEVIRLFADIQSRIKADFRQKGKSPAATIRSLCLYVMSLGRKNSLLPGTDRCGAPGEEKEFRVSTGRPKIDATPTNYVMTNDDKERCAIGLQLVSDGKTQKEAYLECCNAFWSDHITGAFGNLTTKLWDPSRRPSFQQFCYWGKKGETEVATKLFSPLRLDRRTNRDGSPSADIHAVGVLGEFDSTGCDVYLTSVTSRLRRLPPMKRYLIKCPRTKAVLGFHVDWAAPSPRLALRTILAAAEDKHQLCKRYGIECPPGEWPGVFLSSYRVDNGEMRAAEITDAENEFGFRIEFTKSQSGELKPNVESQHKTDHLALDHRLPGTTRGRQKKRGEAEPVENALYQFHEYMRCLLKNYLEHNRQLVPELAPIEMIKEGIAPSRINIFKWYCRIHQSKLIPVDIEHLRCFTLPSWPATLSDCGIQLMDESGKRTLKALRYSSAELHKDARFQKACKTRRSYRIDVRVDTNDVSKIYVPLSTGMTWIPNVATVDDDRSSTCLADLVAFTEDNLKARRDGKAEAEQIAAETVFERGQIAANARKEKRKELSELRKLDSKGAGSKKKASEKSEVTGESLIENAKREAALLFSESKHAVADAIRSLESSDVTPRGATVKFGTASRDPEHLAFMAEIHKELGYGG